MIIELPFSDPEVLHAVGYRFVSHSYFSSLSYANECEWQVLGLYQFIVTTQSPIKRWLGLSRSVSKGIHARYSITSDSRTTILLARITHSLCRRVHVLGVIATTQSPGKQVTVRPCRSPWQILHPGILDRSSMIIKCPCSDPEILYDIWSYHWYISRSDFSSLKLTSLLIGTAGSPDKRTIPRPRRWLQGILSPAQYYHHRIPTADSIVVQATRYFILLAPRIGMFLAGSPHSCAGELVLCRFRVTMQGTDKR